MIVIRYNPGHYINNIVTWWSSGYHIVVLMAETVRPLIRLRYPQYDNPSNDILITIWWITILWYRSPIFIILSHIIEKQKKTASPCYNINNTTTWWLSGYYIVVSSHWNNYQLINPATISQYNNPSNDILISILWYYNLIFITIWK